MTRESVAELADGCRILVGLLRQGILGYKPLDQPAAELLVPRHPGALLRVRHRHAATIGPLVLPGQTACYMCYRMRRWPAEDDSRPGDEL